MDKETGTSEDHIRKLEDHLRFIHRLVHYASLPRTLKGCETLLEGIQLECIKALHPMKELKWLDKLPQMSASILVDSFKVASQEPNDGCIRSSNGDDEQADQPITVSSSGIRETPL